MSKRNPGKASAESGFFDNDRTSVNSQGTSSSVDMSEPHSENHRNQHPSARIGLMRLQNHNQQRQPYNRQNQNPQQFQRQIQQDIQEEESDEEEEEVEHEVENGEVDEEIEENEQANDEYSDEDPVHQNGYEDEDALVDLTNDDEEDEEALLNGHDTDEDQQNHRPHRHNARRSTSVEFLGPPNLEEEIIAVSTIPNEVRLRKHEIVSMADFEKLKVLGTGAYGKVVLVRKLNGFDSGKLYAMKMLPKIQIVQKKKTTEHTKTERIILEKIIGLPFLVNLIYAFQTDERLYLVLDYVGGGELFTHLYKRECFGEELTRFYIAELICAIEQLHEKNIIYRDVKLENILLDKDGHVVLTDFGLSKLLARKDALAQSFCGTIEYMAPEVCNQGVGHGLVIDWWSIGVLCVELYTGTSPFAKENDESSSQADTAQRIKEEEPNIGSQMRGDALDLVKKLLVKDPEERLGFREGAIELKRHPFFKNINWEDLKNRKVRPLMVPVIRDATDVSNFSEDFTTMSTEDQEIEIPRNVDRMFHGFEFVNPRILNLMRQSAANRDADEYDEDEDIEVVDGEEEIDEDQEQDIDEDQEMSEEQEMSEIVDEEEGLEIPEEAVPEHQDIVDEIPLESLDINSNRPILENLLRLESSAQHTSPFFLKYQLDSRQPLGTGKFSICMTCSDRETQEQFAVKIVNVNNVDITNNEVNALKACTRNNHIVKFHEDLRDEYFVYIVMELLCGEELLGRIRNEEMFTEKNARLYFKQIVDGVRHMHAEGYVHRDLKPENILFKDVTSQELKIVDFGFAVPKSSNTSKKLALTPHYASPEAFQSVPAEFSRDMWSLGVILYVMLCGTTPFLSESQEVSVDNLSKLNKLMENIKMGNFTTSSESYKKLSKEAKNLIEGLLKTNIEERFNMTAVLSHTWLKKRGSKNDPILNANNDFNPENIGFTLKAYDQVQEDLQTEINAEYSEEDLEEDSENLSQQQMQDEKSEHTYEDLRFKDFEQPCSSKEVPVANVPAGIVIEECITLDPGAGDTIPEEADKFSEFVIFENIQIVPGNLDAAESCVNVENITEPSAIESYEVTSNLENSQACDFGSSSGLEQIEDNVIEPIVDAGKNTRRQPKTKKNYNKTARATRSKVEVKEEPINETEIIDQTEIINEQPIEPVVDSKPIPSKRKYRSRCEYEIMVNTPIIENRLRRSQILNYKISSTNQRLPAKVISQDNAQSTSVVKQENQQKVLVQVTKSRKDLTIYNAPLKENYLRKVPVKNISEVLKLLLIEIDEDYTGFKKIDVTCDFTGRMEPTKHLLESEYFHHNSNVQLKRLKSKRFVSSSSAPIRKRRRAEVDGIEALMASTTKEESIKKRGRRSDFQRFSDRLQVQPQTEEQIPVTESSDMPEPPQTSTAQAIPTTVSSSNKGRKRKADSEVAAKKPADKRQRKPRQPRKKRC